MDKAKEIKYLKAFAEESDFSEQLCREQLRSLWTAYCFHQNLDVATGYYDDSLLNLWNRINEVNDAASLLPDWPGYEKFDLYMGAYLA